MKILYKIKAKITTRPMVVVLFVNFNTSELYLSIVGILNGMCL